MTIALPGRAVVFDYGEVISSTPSAVDRDRMVALAGVPADRFWAAYHQDRDRLDVGVITTTEYWSGIGRSCGVSWPLPVLQQLWALDFRSWTTADPDVVQVLADLAAGGTRLALLSNAAPDYGGAFRFSPIGALFEHVFVSGELRMTKPEPAIYRHVVQVLGLPPDRLVFVDNRADNVRGAQAVGLTGHVHTDATALRAFLASLV